MRYWTRARAPEIGFDRGWIAFRKKKALPIRQCVCGAIRRGEEEREWLEIQPGVFTLR